MCSRHGQRPQVCPDTSRHPNGQLSLLWHQYPNRYVSENEKSLHPYVWISLSLSFFKLMRIYVKSIKLLGIDIGGIEFVLCSWSSSCSHQTPITHCQTFRVKQQWSSQFKGLVICAPSAPLKGAEWCSGACPSPQRLSLIRGPVFIDDPPQWIPLILPHRLLSLPCAWTALSLWSPPALASIPAPYQPR